MRRLSGADAYFVYQETRAQLLHTLKIFIVDHSGSPHAQDYARVYEQMDRVVRHVAPYRWRMLRIPLGLGLPLWYDDPNLDLDYHLRRAAVPAPGGPREFAEVLSIIASFPLEHDRPLWQLWVVEGLEHGHVAFVMKIHHALADGGSSAQLLVESTSVAESPSECGAWPTPVAEPIPSKRQLLSEGLRTGLQLAANLPSLLSRTLRTLNIILQRRRLGIPQPPRPYSSPPTRFNRPLTPHRWYACVSVPLADVLFVKNALQVSVNDVLLGLTSSAVRSYLQAHGELPAEALTASVPVSIRRPEETQDYGNRLASWYVGLATDVSDPLERLRSVARNTRIAKENLLATDPALQHDWMDQWLLWNFFWRRLNSGMRKFGKHPVFNMIVANVRGPAQAIVYEGSRLVAIQSMGPLMGDMGLNVTAWSYADQFSIGIVACREHVPDIWDLAERFPVALQELCAAIRSAEASSDPGVARAS